VHVCVKIAHSTAIHLLLLLIPMHACQTFVSLSTCRNDGKPRHPHYIDVHSIAPFGQRLEAHKGHVDSLFYYQPQHAPTGFLYTAGDRKVLVWRYAANTNKTTSIGSSSSVSSTTNIWADDSSSGSGSSWEAVCMALKDTALLTTIVPANGSLLCAASSGSIREVS
jgi:hypothetical protein